MSGESDDEDFVVYGTPLDPIDEDTIPKKRPLTIEDQVAKDKYGRRRFHGAFTGGFSAGFFNTVGSLEGWKPSQFTSSRSTKSQSKVQRPEDFMDEEDMEEHGIAPKVLRPTGDYRSSEGTSRKRQMTQFSDGPIPGMPVLRTLLEPIRETVGIKLLMKMGWKPGQGVGPRLLKSEKSAVRKFQSQAKVYGCALPGQDQTNDSDSEESGDETFNQDVTFAPDDLEPYVVKPKDNSYGLGYSGLDRRPVLSHVNLFEPTGPSLVMEEKKKKVSIRGQAFGVGAFEGEDEDIYATEDMSQYDFALDTPRMLADKRKQERNSRLALPSPASDVLEGFVVCSVPVVRKRYAPPTLPPGFTPHHQSRVSRFNSGPSSSDTARLSANERAVMVNELTAEVPQDKPKPVEVERSSTTFRPFVADPDKQMRYEQFLTLSKQGQPDELKRLQPFTMTEWERERERAEFEQAARLYRPLSAAFSDRFVSAGQPDSTDPLVPVERSNDIDQDVKNAAKCKMFGKLTRRLSEWQPHSILCKRFNIPQPGVRSSGTNPKTSRPKFSIFNFLDAAPFNNPSASSEQTSTQKMEVDTSKSDIEVSPTPPPSTSVTQSNTEAIVSQDKDMEQLVESTNKMDLFKAIFLSSSDESDGEEEKLEKPASQEQPLKTLRQEPSKQPSAAEVNVLRNTSPPRGIFANLDLVQLTSQKKKSVMEQDKKEEVNNIRESSPPRGIFSNIDLAALGKKDQSRSLKTGESTVTVNVRDDANLENSQSQMHESNMYGPALPSSITKPQSKQSDIRRDASSESEDDWVELERSSDSEQSHIRSSKKKSKKSHRKSKRHKEKKHKRKKKKSR
ncbi:G patch domain-containing protein 1 [Homalodisca vitripennis]|nr:G patch domain-containing protein 1 [Homalodisca vitripennis]